MRSLSYGVEAHAPPKRISFPNSVWERTAAKLRFACCVPRADVSSQPARRNGVSRGQFPNGSLGTRRASHSVAEARGHLVHERGAAVLTLSLILIILALTLTVLFW